MDVAMYAGLFAPIAPLLPAQKSTEYWTWNHEGADISAQLLRAISQSHA